MPSDYVDCTNYTRPEGILGGPCLTCGRPYMDHLTLASTHATVPLMTNETQGVLDPPTTPDLMPAKLREMLELTITKLCDIEEQLQDITARLDELELPYAGLKDMDD